MERRGQFNFVWLFAILAGGAILMLAIWGALQTGDTLRYGEDTKAGKSISILTNPLQSGFGESSYGVISFQNEVRIDNICSASGFGNDAIAVSTKSNVGEEWNLAGGTIIVQDKYIFSEERIQGEDFYVISKAFEFPYKISDMIFLFSDNYCFTNAPDFIADEVLGLRIEAINIVNCSDDDVRVCFGSGVDCDMYVYGSCDSGCDSVYDVGVVSKNDGSYYYVGDLLYAAIFSNKYNYDCNVARLLYRTAAIGEIFENKVDLMNARNCNTNLLGKLIYWRGMLQNSTSEDLIDLVNYADNLGKANNAEDCGLW